MAWIDEQRNSRRRELLEAGWDPQLPIVPPCRHVATPHPERPIETHADLVDYTLFVSLGWEHAGYCWSYVPAFLHQWFGCGPQQTPFAERV